MKGRVYKRGKVWYYRFDMEPDPLTGKRQQVNGSGFATEREAWKECRAAMAEHEKGRVVWTSRRKVAAALDEWLTRIEHSIKPSMAQNWRNYAAYYVVPYASRRSQKRHPPRMPFTCAGSRPMARSSRAVPTGMTRCAATGSTPKTTR